MQRAGHKTEAVYRRYAITADDDLREGAARLDAVGTFGRNNKAIAKAGASTQSA
jgi:hypothetical protein